MDAIQFLNLIQQGTNTKGLKWCKEYQDWLTDDLIKSIGISDVKKISGSISATLDELNSYPLPTRYESMLHYPLLFNLLQELYEIKDVALDNCFFEDLNLNIPLPVIGTADLRKINAYAKPDYNLIIVDRSLVFFLSNIVTLVVALVTTKQSEKMVIQPSKLDINTLIKRISGNLEICRQFTEIICAYVLFYSTWAFERYHLGNEDQVVWSETISRETLRFVVGHEFAHILFQDKVSTPDIEQRADWIGAYLCAVSIYQHDDLRQLDIYWSMAITAKALDILEECRKIFDLGNSSHPTNRIYTIKKVLKKVKADPYALEMVDVVHRVFILLWHTVKNAVVGISNAWNHNEIQTIDDVKSIISYLK